MPRQPRSPLAKFLTSKEAAAYLRYSTSQLAKLRHYGCGPPYFKVRGRVFYKVPDINRWLKLGHSKKAGAPKPARPASHA